MPIRFGSVVLGIAAAMAAQPSPPWSRGANDPAASRGFTFQVADVDNVPDLHGDPCGARLALFIGGNQFMALPDLVAAFERSHPSLRGHIYYETLPPGILRKQLAAGGRLTLGNLTIEAQADVYEAGARVVSGMEKSGQVERSVSYATNTLEIMVHAGNPRRIESLRDLAAPGVRLSMPNPEWEGVANQIAASLERSGGQALVTAVMKTKVADGTTLLTQIHHRQTAMRIMSGAADAGVTWSSEVAFQEKIGNPIAGVKIPERENVTGIYAAGVLRGAPHADAARAWVTFLTSDEAQAIYRKYGFGPAPGAATKRVQP